MQAYASFGSPTIKPEQLELESAAYQAGVAYAKAHPQEKKLPRWGEANGVKFPVVRSSTLHALAFVKGWKAVKSGKKA